jgi:hypothetical protein
VSPPWQNAPLLLLLLLLLLLQLLLLLLCHRLLPVSALLPLQRTPLHPATQCHAGGGARGRACRRRRPHFWLPSACFAASSSPTSALRMRLSAALSASLSASYSWVVGSDGARV